MGPYIGKAKASRLREGFIPNPKLKLLDQVIVSAALAESYSAADSSSRCRPLK